MTPADGQETVVGGPAPQGEAAPDAEEPREDDTGSDDGGSTATGAWESALELLDHLPDSLRGSLLAGEQRGMSGGRVDGDLVMGHKYVVAAPSVGEQLQGTGEVPSADLDRLATVYHRDPVFDEALTTLHTSRVVVLRGGHGTGRHAAALMLLRAVGATRIRALDPDTGLAGLLRKARKADGYLVRDLPVTASSPLRHHHLLAWREHLTKHRAHLVVTVESTAVLGEDVPVVSWTPPRIEAVFTAHLRAGLEATRRRTGDARQAPDADHPDTLEEEVAASRELAPVRRFLAVRSRPVTQVAAFAAEVVRYQRGEVDLKQLERFGEDRLREQVGEWFSDSPGQVELRDKAFLLSLAVCDEGPYPLVAELGDQLYRRLRRVEDPEQNPGVPVFGTSLRRRMVLAHAEEYEASEQTSWGPVRQTKIRFQERRTARLLLCEVWTGHPAVRAPLSTWLTGLARHGDPFVRTRAAAAAATLARHDFPSVMHGLLRGWATSADYRLCAQAANALALVAAARIPAVHRVLREWSDDSHPRRRWTAVRAYALIGPLVPGDTLDSLEKLARPTSARRDEATGTNRSGRSGGKNGGRGDGTGQRGVAFDSLVEAAELLLLSTPGTEVMRRLATWCEDSFTGLRDLARRALLDASARREDPSDDPASWPILLRRYAEHSEDAAERAAFARLWRHVLRDRAGTEDAQEQLREWVLVADREPGVEAVLAELLPRLAVSDSDRDRLRYLLRTMSGETGGPPPPVAARLLSTLPPGAPAASQANTRQRAGAVRETLSPR